MRLWFAACLAFLLLCSVARAQTCTLSVSNLDFGPADLLPGTAVDSSATVTVSCSGMPLGSTTYYCLGFGAGSPGVSGGSRIMAGPSGGQIRYGLYADPGRTYPWASRSTPTLGYVFGQGSTADIFTGTVILYGRIAASQSTVPTGSYSSTLSSADVGLFTLVQPSSDCNAGPIASVPQASASFSVLASPAPHCAVTTTNIDFGSQPFLNANVDATGSVSVTCTSSLLYTVGLSNGVSGTGPTNRLMTNSGVSIRYGLYRDSARSQPWGDTSGVMASGTGTGLAQLYTVYGRAPAQATPVPATYSDTVNVTVTY